MGIAANMKEKWRNVALVAGLVHIRTLGLVASGQVVPSTRDP